jgi:hypothetical protein
VTRRGKLSESNVSTALRNKLYFIVNIHTGQTQNLRAAKFQLYNKGSLNSKLLYKQVRQVLDFRVVTNS